MSAAPTVVPEAGTGVFSKTRARIAERTLRTDRWWLPPLITVLGLGAFVVYATIRSFVRTAYWVPEYHYLTPFYSPCLSASCVPGSSHFGQPFPELPMWIPLGFVVLPFLLGFRLTCYYYRKAYYRSVWFSPPACAVAEPHRRYTGETRLPLIVQNAHRYFFYVALVVSVINTYDALVAFHGADGGFGFGLGNIVLLGNVILLWAYTLSCHSCRHIAGGRLKHFSAHPVRYWFWTQVSKLNTRHMALAWTTLGTLVLTDFYVMLVASDTISDLRFIN
ncbi:MULTISPECIES: hypothetical protein [Nocardia]|uniref:Succinate dehydrogenase membrane anchor subunit n=2 Tax=Nocardia farcinica TaxID=37329 RepID=Q5YMY8_NOCFA|nr:MULTISPECIES: hypothetical protein [Nocardia]AXK87181.1 hypothetical protein DXT66_17495 [Nocardia farcinica]MBA4856981.1 hypothetical protein [Nocardia farcinica]MBC9815484.1 hypothetical protein [Nocardia farcinica]MBF6270843.1 hypothetical protein [Nocardia farcinica]MBF6312342.1 hypothetical protein [Nocardia farcinica]